MVWREGGKEGERREWEGSEEGRRERDGEGGGMNERGRERERRGRDRDGYREIIIYNIYIK